MKNKHVLLLGANLNQVNGTHELKLIRSTVLMFVELFFSISVMKTDLIKKIMTIDTFMRQLNFDRFSEF